MRSTGVLLWVFAATMVACGGGPPKGAKVVAKDRRGNVVTLDDGTQVSEAAHQRWKRGIERFEAAENEGWTSDRCSDVSDAFEEASETQRGFAEALYMVGLSAARCGDSAKAKQYYERALQANESLCEARAALGVMMLKSGNREAALAAFLQAIRNDARCKEAYVNAAILQGDQGKAQAAEARLNLRRALAVESSYLPAFNELALWFLRASKEREKGGEELLDLAETVCRQAQLNDEGYAPIYNTWGLIKMERSEIIEALRFFERARQLDPNMFEANMNFGEITLSFRGYEDAKAAFEKATSLRPNSYEAHISLGVAYRGLEQPDRAEAEYKKAMEINPRRPEAYFNLGLLYQDYRQGTIEDFREAKKYFGAFLERAGGDKTLAEAAESVRRRCRERKSSRRHRPSSACRPGRLQNIETAIEALEEIERIKAQSGAS